MNDTIERTEDVTDEEASTRNKEIEGLITMIEALAKLRGEHEKDKEAENSDRVERLSLDDFKKKMYKHVGNNTLRILRDEEALETEVYIKETSDSNVPGSIFIANKINGRYIAGSRFDFHSAKGNQMGVASEDFHGVALGVILDDLEADGYE